MAKSNKVKEEYLFMLEKMSEEQIEELMKVTDSTCNSQGSKSQNNPSGKCKRLNPCAVHNGPLYMCPCLKTLPNPMHSREFETHKRKCQVCGTMDPVKEYKVHKSYCDVCKNK